MVWSIFKRAAMPLELMTNKPVACELMLNASGPIWMPTSAKTTKPSDSLKRKSNTPCALTRPNKLKLA